MAFKFAFQHGKFNCARDLEKDELKIILEFRAIMNQRFKIFRVIHLDATAELGHSTPPIPCDEIWLIKI